MTSSLESLSLMGINVFWSITIVFKCDGNELPTPFTTQAHTGRSHSCDVSSAQLSSERLGDHRVKIREQFDFDQNHDIL